MGTSINRKLKDWFAKYQVEQISREEFRELRQEVNNYTDEELFPVLLDSWNNSKYNKTLSPEDAQDILLRIRRDIATSPASVKKIRTFNLRQIAATVALFVLGSLSLYLYIDNRNITLLADRIMEVKVGKGERVSITLPDGTAVKLNSESLLSYKQDFGKKDRRVSLSGEGYFEVRKDTQKKFVVNTEFMEVEVTGTSFNVYAYSDKEMMEMALVQGSVIVSSVHPPFEKINVVPNEKVIYDKKTGKMKKITSSNILETAWVSKELVFRSEPLEEVLKRVGRKYGVFFDIADSSFIKETYTGVFDKEEIEDVMNILRIHYEFDYRIKGDEIQIFANRK
ncbi:FecR domain-containing protein [uncultured Parabacteroides sp.]|jgi:transmembrane sensor|uniref:FecR family protein n=1 Tax=uncultured Parabacteroides sp. TaxID=512312 RepID=UPI0025CCA547|nr:FecR domain-containing protein [uncultured Parabacteroides sp.]